MLVTDPIADLLTRIRNGKTAKHRFINVPLSRMKRSIVEVLEEAGYIDRHLVDEKKREMRVFIRYKQKSRMPVLQGLKRISKPGQRIFVKCNEIPMVQSGLGIAILSTPQGVVSSKKAKQLNVGGELLAYVW